MLSDRLPDAAGGVMSALVAYYDQKRVVLEAEAERKKLIQRVRERVQATQAQPDPHRVINFWKVEAPR